MTPKPPPVIAGPRPLGTDNARTLGALLFTWRYGWPLRLILTALALLIGGTGWSMRHHDPAMFWAMISMATPLALFALRAWTSILQIFEQGVRRRSWGFSRILRHDQIESMVYYTRHEQDWNFGAEAPPSDAGFRVHLRLDPIRGAGLRTIRFDAWRQADIDPAFDHLRNHAATCVSQRMLQRIEAGERVAWGRYAVFTRRGLFFRPRWRVLFRGAWRHFEAGPFYRGVQENKAFRIYELGENRPLFSLSDRTTNFHAGYMVFVGHRFPSPSP